jgi:hypothetical protein
LAGGQSVPRLLLLRGSSRHEVFFEAFMLVDVLCKHHGRV